VSLAAWALALGAWHVPAVYDYALAHETVHDLEHLCFIVAGLLVWAQLVDPARRNSLRERLGCMVAMGAFTLALGTVLIATPSLYPAYAHPEVRLFGLGASLDQRLAAAVMLAEQLAALGVCAWYLLRGRVVPRRVPVRARVALTD
jgi:putative membrane protein